MKNKKIDKAAEEKFDLQVKKLRENFIYYQRSFSVKLHKWVRGYKDLAGLEQSGLYLKTPAQLRACNKNVAQPDWT